MILYFIYGLIYYILYMVKSIFGLGIAFSFWSLIIIKYLITESFVMCLDHSLSFSKEYNVTGLVTLA